MADAPNVTILWYVAVFLRNNPEPVLVRQASREIARRTVGFVAKTWLSQPVESRQTTCWIAGFEAVETKVDDRGVSEVPVFEAIAAFDTRDVVAVHATWRAIAEGHPAGSVE